MKNKKAIQGEIIEKLVMVLKEKKKWEDAGKPEIRVDEIETHNTFIIKQDVLFNILTEQFGMNAFEVIRVTERMAKNL